LVLTLALSLVVVTAIDRVTRLTVAATGAVGEYAEHYGKPGIERSFRVAARTIATCRPPR